MIRSSSDLLCTCFTAHLDDLRALTALAKKHLLSFLLGNSSFSPAETDRCTIWLESLAHNRDDATTCWCRGVGTNLDRTQIMSQCTSRTTFAKKKQSLSGLVCLRYTLCTKLSFTFSSFTTSGAFSTHERLKRATQTKFVKSRAMAEV